MNRFFLDFGSPRSLKGAKGSPKEDQERPEGDPKEGQERHKRAPRATKRRKDASGSDSGAILEDFGSPRDLKKLEKIIEKNNTF